MRQAGVQLANTVLANPAAAGRAVLAAAGLIAAGNNSSRQTQQQILQTERKMARPNQSPEQIADYQAQLAEQQSLLNEINGVMLKAKKMQGEANQSQNKTEKNKSQSKDKCGSKQPCNNIFPSRQAAFQQAKRDLGVARNQRPLNGQYPNRKEPLTYNDHGIEKPVLGRDGKPVMSRKYHYNRINDKGQQEEVIIQEHSQGHRFDDGGIEGPHFNVRPASDPKHGSIPGTQSHYYFE